MKKAKIPSLKSEKISCELLTLTYGAIVTQILKDFENVQEANIQLEKMGFDIGVRLIDEFLAKSDTKFCSSYKEIAETLAKTAFEMFLGVKSEISNFQNDKEKGCSFSILINDNPLNDFVELPESYSNLSYSNIICGVIRGAMSTLQINAKCNFVKDTLKGDDISEIKVDLVKESQNEEKEKNK